MAQMAARTRRPLPPAPHSAPAARDPGPGAQPAVRHSTCHVRGGGAAPIQRMRFDPQGRSRSWYQRGGEDYSTSDAAGFQARVAHLQGAANRPVLNTMLGELRANPSTRQDEAVGRSKVRRALDETEAMPAAPADPNQLTLAHLPKSQWWKLFIDRSQHDPTQSGTQNALRFDNQQSPGFYETMMHGFEQHVLPGSPANPMGHDFATYDAMHQAVTRGVLRDDDSGGFENVPHQRSDADVQFPMTLAGHEPNPEALRELTNEGVAGLDRGFIHRIKTQIAGGIDGLKAGSPRDREVAALAEQADAAPDNAYLSRFQRVRGPGGAHQTLVTTDRPQAQVPAAVNGLFAQLDGEVAASAHLPPAAQRDAKLTAIARTVRAMHVGHFYSDANGRLNTMLMMNRLLQDHGFSPAMIDDPAHFGGSKTVAELTTEMKRGMGRFRTEVHRAHGIGAFAPPAVPLPGARAVDDAPLPPPRPDAERARRMAALGLL